MQAPQHKLVPVYAKEHHTREHTHTHTHPHAHTHTHTHTHTHKRTRWNGTMISQNTPAPLQTRSLYTHQKSPIFPPKVRCISTRSNRQILDKNKKECKQITILCRHGVAGIHLMSPTLNWHKRYPQSDVFRVEPSHLCECFLSLGPGTRAVVSPLFFSWTEFEI